MSGINFVADRVFTLLEETTLPPELVRDCNLVSQLVIENGLSHPLNLSALGHGALSVSTEQMNSLVELLYLFDKTSTAVPQLWIWVAAIVFTYRRSRKRTGTWLKTFSRLGVRENPPNKRAILEILTGIQDGLNAAESEALKLQMWTLDGRQPGNVEYEQELGSVISSLVNRLTEQGIVEPLLQHLPRNSHRSSIELSGLTRHLSEIQETVSRTVEQVERLDLAPGKPKTRDRAMPALTQGFSVLWKLLSGVEPNFNNQPNMPSFIQKIEAELEACVAPFTSWGLDYKTGDGEFTVFVKATCTILSGPNVTHGRLRTAYLILNRSS